MHQVQQLAVQHCRTDSQIIFYTGTSYEFNWILVDPGILNRSMHVFKPTMRQILRKKIFDSILPDNFAA